MNDELNDLKRDYRSIDAPPYLATRIHAEVAGDRARAHSWMPAVAMMFAVLAVVWMLPLTWQQAELPATPIRPSLSAWASLKPTKPRGPAPSLTRMKSVSVPRMPAKPRPARPLKPQSNYHYENDTFKENDHAYI